MWSKKLIIITGILLISCISEDQAPAIAAVNYQLYCSHSNGCNGLVNKPSRVVERAVNGQEGFRVNCLKGDKLADLSLDFSRTDYGLSVESVPPGASSDCTVSIRESNNVYQKSCVVARGTEADCSAEAAYANGFTTDIAEMPCQLTVKTEGSTVTGTICCRNIPEGLKQVQGNEYSLILSQDSSKPATFEFKHCR